MHKHIHPEHFAFFKFSTLQFKLGQHGPYPAVVPGLVDQAGWIV